MVHIPAALAESKPVEIVEGTEHLAMSDLSAVVAALERLVESGAGGPGEEDEEEAYDVRNGALAPFHELWRYPLVHRLVPGLEQLAGKYHWGNYVVVRATGERIFESMPIYTR